jgi:pentatricopeptide repeat protein
VRIKEPNMVTFSVLISGLIHSGLIPEALSAFEYTRLAGSWE